MDEKSISAKKKEVHMQDLTSVKKEIMHTGRRGLLLKWKKLREVFSIDPVTRLQNEVGTEQWDQLKHIERTQSAVE